MKYLDFPILTQLSSSVSSNPTPELRVHARFEAYSVKPIGKERKMFKEMEELYVSEQEGMEGMSFSPEMREAGLSSCFGRLDEKESRKVHFLLVATLNSAFPDHDFASLRPDHFTREPSSSQVLGHLSGSLLGSGAGETSMLAGQIPLFPNPHPGGAGSSAPSHISPPSMWSSPSKSPTVVTNPDLYRILNEVVFLDESEVYSWFPEPEYDPHIQADDGEASEYGFELAEEDEEELVGGAVMEGIEIDPETPASWGQAGMDLDEGPASVPMARTRSMSGKAKRSSDDVATGRSDDETAGLGSRSGGLLWSANYFFYSKRQKRVLFLTCWCRKRPSHSSSPSDPASFPLPISSSFAPPTQIARGTAPMSSLRSYRPPRSSHNRSNARPGQRKSKVNLKAAAKGDTSNTIPIRGFETPKANRMAASAPSTYSPINSTASPAAPLARMSAGGFKPRQTAARTIINNAAKDRAEEERVRKERSGSATPRQGHLAGLVDPMVGGKKGMEPTGSKRVKV